MNTIAENAANVALRAVIGIARLVPFNARVKAFGWLTGNVIAPVFGFTKKAVANLQLIHPDMPQHKAQQMARQVCTNFGKSLIENYSKPDLLAAMRTEDMEGPGLDDLTAAIEEKRPILLVSGHIGNYEVVRLALLKMGHQTGCIFRPAANEYFNRHFTKTYSELTGPAFPQTSKGFLGFSRYLAKGGIAAMLFDVRAAQFDDIEFLGQPAPTSDVPAKIAMKYNALFIPCFSHRQPDGITHTITIEKPIEHTTPKQMMTDVSQRLEAQIKNYPDQWFWVHDRWGSAKFRKRRAAERLAATASS